MFVVATFPHGQVFIDTLNAITGWELDMEGLLKIGERIANIRHAFNIREGLNAREFKIPDRILGNPPKTEGPIAGITLNKDEMYNEFLTAMDWDLETVKPSREKLLELGLNDVADILWQK